MRPETKVYVPPIKTQGIKTKLVPLIRTVAEMDDDTVWVEPFMGSGVVGFNIAPKRAVFADTNAHLINFYSAIKNGEITPEIVRDFLQGEGKKLEDLDGEYYYEVRKRFNEHHRPLDFLFLNRSCFNGMIRFNRNHGFNVPYGHKPFRFSKAYITKIANQVAHVQDLLRHNDWEFVAQPFDKTIADAPESAFIYCDPPYTGRHVDYYDSWDENQEHALHDALVSHGSRFMVSTWDRNSFRKNQLVDTLWTDCVKTTKEHFYFVGGHESNRNPMLEALLTSYRPTRSNDPTR